MIPTAQDMERLGRKIWGEPNRAMSSRYELRFGTNGSKSLDLRNLRWFDHEADKGGGYYKLFEMAGEPLSDNVAEPHFVATYDYYDERGALLFQVVRKPKDARRRFVQRRPSPGAPGKWTWDTKGVRRVLYRLPELLDAAPDAPVFVVEGEKDTDNVRAIGLTATCASGGAGKWEPEYGQHLRGRDVVILPDNDKAGRDHAALVVRSLTGVARSIRVLALPGLAEKADVSDWLAAGGTRDKLLALVTATPEMKPGGTHANGHVDQAPEGGEISDDDAQAEIARLAALPAVPYARARAASAKLLGVTAGILDRLVKAERGDGADTKGQGRPLDLPAPEPWPEPVDGAALLTALGEHFTRHAVLPEHAATALSLWSVHCHCFTKFTITPRLHIKAAVKGAGKSTLLQLVGMVAPKALETETASVAALFRVIELFAPVLLLDEADLWVNRNEALRAVLNAGHKAGSMALRCVGDDSEARAFNCRAPAALASIGNLPDTIEDRSIRITMQRRLRSESIEAIDDTTKATAENLRRLAARWARDHADKLAAARPDMGALINRAADRWRPLYSIADLAGGPWPEAVRAAMSALSADDDGASQGERLVRDIHHVLGDWIAEHPQATEHEIASAEMTDLLVALPASPWAEMGRARKPLTSVRLARMLAPFNVWPIQIGPRDDRRKGYRLTDFDPLFVRILGGGG